ncbi:MAG TPA: UvrD-helicase domain-containing protein, partial [Pirellulales bacterium]|nr:UvrD-helicase domain-containing protein [Pirellulales bacterium]
MIQQLKTQKLGREFPNVVIRASAGTGKTYQLSNRYIALAVAGASPEQILAVTFARKAAGEILDRVLLRLAEGALDAKKAADLAHALEDSRFDRAGAMTQLCQLTRQLHRLRIGTLDGFFVKMATHFSLELGMPPGWRIVDALEDTRLQSEAIHAVLARKSTTDMVALLQLLSKGDVKRSVTSQIAEAVENLYTLYRETTRDAWHTLNRRKTLEPEQLAAAIIAVANVPVGDAKRWIDARDADFGRATSEDWARFLGNGLAAKIHSEENTYYKKPIDP